MIATKPYDDALQQILEHGVEKENRTGVKTKAIFGMLSRYRLDEYFPLITGRRIKPEVIWAELLWFLSGSSNNKDLQKLGANFWTPWVNKEFEEKHHYSEGSLGPVYGFQLRHFGGRYGTGEMDQTHLGENLYGKDGIDQLSSVIDLLKNDPDSRRIVWSLWNPSQLEKMRLPPCHWAVQFFVDDGKLSLMLIQRSCDFPVGVPFNIAFYSALTHMIAQQTDLQPFELVHITCDSHIYIDQIPAVEEYLARSKPGPPTLKLHRASDIDSYKIENFELLNYDPCTHIKIPVAV